LEIDDSLPSTDPEGVVQEIDQILIDPERERELLADFRKDKKMYGVADPAGA
jgi:hypothetical protein